MRPISPVSLLRCWSRRSIFRSLWSTCRRRRCICRDKLDFKVLLLGGMGGLGRRLEAAELLGVGELVEVLEAEELEEERGGLVEERAAGLLAAAGDGDDLALEERGDDAV